MHDRACRAPGVPPLAGLVGQPTDPRELVKRGLKAIGGTDAVRRINSVTYDFPQVTYGLGQEETPFSPAGGTNDIPACTTRSAPIRSTCISMRRAACSQSSRVVVPAGPIAVQLTELSPGVWHATGGTHHSLVVEQPTSLILEKAAARPQAAASR